MWVLITFKRQKMLMDNKYLALVQQDTAITPLCRIKAAVTGKSDWPLTLARTWGEGGMPPPDSFSWLHATFF